MEVDYIDKNLHQCIDNANGNEGSICSSSIFISSVNLRT